jgi:hypothetical protein
MLQYILSQTHSKKDGESNEDNKRERSNSKESWKLCKHMNMKNISDRKKLSTKDVWKDIITSKNEISVKIGWRIFRWEGSEEIEVQTVEIGRFREKNLYFSKVEWRIHTQLSDARVLWDCLWWGMA